jgi:hypothetical protein
MVGDGRMLLLWDHIVEPRSEALEILQGAQLANLALDVIEATLSVLDPPFPEFFPQEHCELINSAIVLRADHPADWQADRDFPEDFLGRYDSLPEIAVRPAVGPFLMAFVRLFEVLPGSLAVDDAMEILSSCYESILMSQLTGRVTLEDQEENDRCREAIRLQLDLISRYLPAFEDGDR